MTEDITMEEASAATARFDRDLESLLLEAFAKGAVVDGTREIALPIEAAPNWTVEISKSHSDGSTALDRDP